MPQAIRCKYLFWRTQKARITFHFKKSKKTYFFNMKVMIQLEWFNFDEVHPQLVFLFRQNQHGNWAWNLIQIDFQDKISASEFMPYNRSTGKGKSTKSVCMKQLKNPKQSWYHIKFSLNSKQIYISNPFPS